MDYGTREKIIRNNKDICRLLFANEQLYREAGYKPPTENIRLDDNDLIQLPSGYIRRSSFFWEKYHLGDIVKERKIRDNISYALQLSDFYNFLLNRIHIWGSVRIMFIKQAFENMISIAEALILESACRINEHCKMCSNIGRCKNHISKETKSNMKFALEKLCAMGILRFSDKERNRMVEFYNMRNRIHIRLSENNEFIASDFNLDLYNECISFVQKIDEELWNRAIPYYTACIGYEPK